MVSKTTKHLRRIQVAAVLILLPLLFAFSTFAAFADSNNNEAKANLTSEITQKLLSEADLSERVMYDLYDATIKEERYYDHYECWGEPPREQCRMVRDYYTVEVSLDEEQFNKSLPKLTAYSAFVKDLDNTYQPAANSSKLVKDSWVKLMEQNKLLSAELAILASKPDLETLQEHRDKFKRNVLKMCDLAYTVHNNKKPRRPKSKTFPFPFILESSSPNPINEGKHCTVMGLLDANAPVSPSLIIYPNFSSRWGRGTRLQANTLAQNSGIRLSNVLDFSTMC